MFNVWKNMHFILSLVYSKVAISTDPYSKPIMSISTACICLQNTFENFFLAHGWYNIFHYSNKLIRESIPFTTTDADSNVFTIGLKDEPESSWTTHGGVKRPIFKPLKSLHFHPSSNTILMHFTLKFWTSKVFRCVCVCVCVCVHCPPHYLLDQWWKTHQ